MPTRKTVVLFAAAGLWLGLCGLGFRALLEYQRAPGREGAAPRRWPAASRLRPAADKSTVVLFAHPRCPCTRASLDSLAWLLGRGRGRAAAYVVFYAPAGAAADWERTDLWAAAAALPGTTVVADAGGVEARLFGAETSGQALLYGGRGSLLFRGGLTGGRGHYGDNAQRDLSLALIGRGDAAGAERPVFGCALQSASALAQERGAGWRRWVRGRL